MKPLSLVPLTMAALLLNGCDRKPETVAEPMREIGGAPARPAAVAPTESGLQPGDLPRAADAGAAQADFDRLTAVQTQFRAERTRRAQTYFAKVMEQLAARLKAEDPGISQESFLTANDHVANRLTYIDEEGRALAEEMQRHRQMWTVRNWSGYHTVEHLPLPVSAHPDMSKWPRSATETPAVTAARADFLERRGALHMGVMAEAEKKLPAGWRHCEQMRASLSTPPSEKELKRFGADWRQVRSGMEAANRAVQDIHAESEKLWNEWEAKEWTGYVIEEKPPGADRVSLLPEK